MPFHVMQHRYNRCLSPRDLQLLLACLQEEEERLAKQTAAGASAAAAAAAEDGFTEAFGDDMLEDGGPLSAAAQQASAAAKRLKAVRDRALAAARAKQKDILESRRMPMVRKLVRASHTLASSCCA
jgi:hypothetical protein